MISNSDNLRLVREMMEYVINNADEVLKVEQAVGVEETTKDGDMFRNYKPTNVRTLTIVWKQQAGSDHDAR